VGIIASVTRPFCADCRRTRLTAEGRVRTCLFSREETDLRTALRSGADDEAIAQIWRAAQWGKKAGHGMDRDDFVQPERPMSAIGG
jgi:cyclic pyranopterin phosphate synthase